MDSSLDIIDTDHELESACKSIMFYNDYTSLIYVCYGSQDMVLANHVLGTQISGSGCKCKCITKFMGASAVVSRVN